jgi:predicted amidohydrolase
VRVGVIQLTSTDDVARNLATARELVADAAARGARLVLLPENFAYLRREGEPISVAQDLDGEIVKALREWARELGVWLHGGSLPERRGDARVHNTSVVVDPQGEVRAVYRKIHLFDVDLRAAGGGRFCESERVAPGEDVVLVETPFGGLGLSVCYDIRFPELFRRLSERGARFLAVPAAFAPETGKDHWEVLLRARAIENQAFVFAPAQCGRHSPTRASYGRSLIVDPWGLILAQAGDRPCAIVADCNLDEQDRLRADLPALSHRRL